MTADIADDADGSALMETLDWIRLHPYDLNCITLDELISIPCVTLSGALAVLEFRRSGRGFRSPEQLLTIGGEGAALYRALSPYTFVPPKGSRTVPPRGVLLRTRVLSDVPGDIQTPGSPLRITSRFVLEGFSGMEAGALFAKGAGERTGDAFVSCYALMRDLGPLTEIVAGDYEIESGEGLVFWRGPTAVRGIWSLRPGRDLAIVPHRRADESRYLRGMAIGVAISGGWRGAIFLSDRAYGARVDTGGEATGFFRGEYSTPGSLSKKDALRERLVGVRAGFARPGKFAAGCTLYRSYFDRSFAPADRMRLAGDRLAAAGVDAGGSIGIFSFSGECAFLGGGARALLLAMTLAPAGSQTAMIRWRDYQPAYDNPHASGEGGNGETRNERGVTAALRLVPSPGLRAEIQFDAFEHPWPDPRRVVPARGTELAITAEAPLAQGSALSARWSRKITYDLSRSADPLGRDTRIGEETVNDRFRCEISSHAGGVLWFSTLVEVSRASGAGSGTPGGVLLGADIRVRPLSPLSFDLHFASFHTDGYGARLYEFESSLPGMLSLPPLYGRGTRWYVLLRWNPSTWMEVAARYAATHKEASVSGTFYDVPASTAAQAGLQLDIRLP